MSGKVAQLEPTVSDYEKVDQVRHKSALSTNYDECILPERGLAMKRFARVDPKV